MKHKRLLVSLGLGVGITLATALLLCSASDQTIFAQSGSGAIRVATIGMDGPGCGGPANPCRTVQHAVDLALPGEEIRVAEGVYTDVHAREGITQVVYTAKSVTIRGGYTTTNWATPYAITQPTTLDAQGQGRVLYVAGDIAVALEGLRITGGDATGLGPSVGWDYGGGVFADGAQVTIDNCVIVSNTASNEGTPWGGGVYLQLSEAALSSNTICGNSASHSFGGRGGGLYAYASQVALSGNTICDNAASSRGGGICTYATDASLNNNAIYGNETIGTGSGGGLYLYNTDGSLTGNRITSNTSAFSGGGLFVENSASILLDNNVVRDNYAGYSGSGLYFEASLPALEHNTIARNTGGDGSGVLFTGSYYGDPSIGEMTNTIIASHTVGVSVKTGSTATLNATLWHANATDREGNVIHARDYGGDPAFAYDGFHLTAASEAIDRGVDAGILSDIDGDTRPQGGGFDIGADEFPLPAADVVWDKQVCVNTGPFAPWQDGPFTVVPGDHVTIVDRVWVTSTGDTSFDLRDEWTPSLEWVAYETTAGAVSTAASTATWSVVGGLSNAWHVLTRTMEVAADRDYLDSLSETLVVVGATYHPPARIVEFQHRRPEPVWDKTVQINGGPPEAWDSGPFIAGPGDTITVTDRVSISHWANVTFTLANSWGSALDLIDWTASAGVAVPGTNALTWQATGEAAGQQHSLTATYLVVGDYGLRESISETLHVQGAALQPPPRAMELLIARASPNCHVRVNDGTVTYATVQSAVDAAQAGDLVKVAGHCSALNVRDGHIQVVDFQKNLTLCGGYTTTNWAVPDVAANPTSLDAQGLGRVVYVSDGATASLEGLHLTRGHAGGLGGSSAGHDAGGGLYASNASAILSGCMVYSNTTGSVFGAGGGVYVYQGAVTLTATVVSSNTAGSAGGGGLFAGYSDATLRGNTISGNSGGWGGGLNLTASDARLTENVVSGNWGGPGGGMSIDGGSVTLSNNAFSGNHGSVGGGAYISLSGAAFDGDVFTDNVGSVGGGGLWVFGQASELVNVVVVGNRTALNGAGILLEASSSRLVHTTVANNTGGDGSGIYVTNYFGDYSNPVLTNSIIASHTVGIHVEADNTATLNGTLWHANTADADSTGSIGHVNDHTGDPAFTADGYHLTADSAAIDAGVDSSVAADLDGDARPAGAGYDLGADEFVAPPATTWEKLVRINAGTFLPWDSGPFVVAPGDVFTVVDRVWITFTHDVDFALETGWDSGLELAEWTSDAGTVVAGSDTLAWEATQHPAGQTSALTSTWHVTGTSWVAGSLTETLTVDGADPQPAQRVMSLFNVGADTGCYARINDGATLFPTVQRAVDAAQPGDLVKVAGTCNSVNTYGGLAQVVYLTKTLTLRGGYTTTNWTTPDPTAYPTTLDAQGQGRVLYVIGDISPTIEGFRITGGVPPVPQSNGGGVYVADAGGLFRGNEISSNAADSGGGVYLHRTSTRLIDNAILSNTVSIIVGYGGGVFAGYGSPTLEGNRIAYNAASYGGGVYLSRSSGTLAGNTISHNAGASGGGVSLYDGAPTLAGNLITENTAVNGGGVYLLGATQPILTNNVIVENQATGHGAIHATWGSAPRLIHTTIARNSGGAGAGVWIAYDAGATTVAMTNTIISNQTVGIHVEAGSSVSLEATLWDNVGQLTDGDGVALIGAVNIIGDPGFSTDGYHLGATSAAVDKGVDAGVATDIDGDERPSGAGFDIGADEYLPRIYLSLVVRSQ